MKNNLIIHHLKGLAAQIKLDISNSKSNPQNPDIYRLKQIEYLISVVSKFPATIKKGEDLADIKGIGKGSIKRINEIIKEGSLHEVSVDVENKEYVNQINELETVYGIGNKTAYAYVKDGIKSVADLRKAYKEGKIDLPYHIILGLKYHEKYKVTIPRKEIDVINKFIQKQSAIVDPKLEVIICGSYRRGLPFSNDIDILVLHKDIKTKKKLESNLRIFKALIENLHDVNFLLDDIDINYKVKYMGFCKYKDMPIRRIDMMFMPYDCQGSALLHFTGPGSFNKKMREVAIMLGYSLSQYGLLDKNTDKIIKTKTEKDIFDKLFLEYVDPKDRN